MGPVNLPTKVGIFAGGGVLVAVIVMFSFGGDVSVAPKPPPPRHDKSAKQVIRETNANVDAFMQGIERDATRAGVHAPTIAELGKAFTFTQDLTRRALIPDGAPIEIGGLQIAARSFAPPASERLIVLDVKNLGAAPIAYRVDTEISGGDSACFGRTILEHNGLVVAPGKTERRSECVFKRGAEVYVARVETAVLTPLAAYYVSRLQPQALGARDRIANGHKPSLPAGVSTCGLAASASIRSGLADGSIEWRDLIDFYARHSCESYQFPDGYRAFVTDSERPLPDMGE